MAQRTRGSIFPPPVSGGMRSRALAEPAPAPAAPAPAPRPPATETLAQRTGSLVNEIDFPGFVAGLVHGTFDAIVDAAIRQMDSYASLVSAVAKTVDQFTEENVTPNQARDWLAQRYPGEVRIAPPTAEQPAPLLVPTAERLTPAWLADYGVEGEELTGELLEERVLPQVRTHVGTERQQLLATMVMLGMNRVVVRDGSITAKVMFRASANDVAKVNYATGSDPKSVADWGERGSLTYSGASSTMVSTLGLNAQSDTSLRADLFGEVKLNFVSETLPLDKLADAAKVALVQRNSAVARPAAAAALPAPATQPAAGHTGGA
jgi:hypothetical protein